MAYCALLNKKLMPERVGISPEEVIARFVEDDEIADYLMRSIRKLTAGNVNRAFGEIVSHVTEEGLEALLVDLDFESTWDRMWHLEHSTPPVICNLALKLLKPLPGSRIADFGSGTGSFLLQMQSEVPRVAAFGIEINRDTACLSRIRLSISRLNDLVKINEYDPERMPQIVATSLDSDIRVGDMLAFHEHGICDYAFSNYPWAMRTADLPDSSGFARLARAGELGYRRPTTAAWIYNHLLVDSITDDGRAVALMASGACFNTTDEGARRYFIERGLVESVITLPPRMFPGTGLSLNVIVFSRGNKAVHMVDASDLVEEGRRTNTLRYGAIDEIMTRLNGDVEGYSKTVDSAELADADYVLSPSRYLQKPLIIKDARRLGEVATQIQRGATLRAGDLDKLTVNEATGYRYLMLSDIQDGNISDELPFLSGIEAKLEKHCIEDGDVLLSKNGAPFKVAVAEVPEDTKILANGNLYVIRVDREVLDPYYLAAFLGSNKGMEVLSAAVVGVTIPNIPLKTLREVPVPVPPIEEQREIVTSYQAKLDEIRILKMRAQRAIDEVRSFFDGEE